MYACRIHPPSVMAVVKKMGVRYLVPLSLSHGRLDLWYTLCQSSVVINCTKIPSYNFIRNYAEYTAQQHVPGSAQSVECTTQSRNSQNTCRMMRNLQNALCNLGIPRIHRMHRSSYTTINSQYKHCAQLKHIQNVHAQSCM